MNKGLQISETADIKRVPGLEWKLTHQKSWFLAFSLWITMSKFMKKLINLKMCQNIREKASKCLKCFYKFTVSRILFIKFIINWKAIHSQDPSV